MDVIAAPFLRPQSLEIAVSCSHRWFNAEPTPRRDGLVQPRIEHRFSPPGKQHRPTSGVPGTASRRTADRAWRTALRRAGGERDDITHWEPKGSAR